MHHEGSQEHGEPHWPTLIAQMASAADTGEANAQGDVQIARALRGMMDLLDREAAGDDVRSEVEALPANLLDLLEAFIEVRLEYLRATTGVPELPFALKSPGHPDEALPYLLEAQAGLDEARVAAMRVTATMIRLRDKIASRQQGGA